MGKKSLSFLVGMLVLVLLVGCLNGENDDPVLYDVTFLGFNDIVLKQEEVEEGKSAVAPTAPEVSGYIFSNWDIDYKNIRSDLTVKAIYKKEEIKTYTVVFLDSLGVILKIENVNENETAVAPNAPTLEGYEFISWDTDFKNVTSDLNIKPIYEEKTYEVIFLDINDEVIKSVNLKHKEDAVAPTAPAVDGYEFISWDLDFTSVIKDLTVRPIYEKILAEYTVTFLNQNGDVLKTVTVKENETALAPNAPAITGYQFVSWDTIFTNVNENLTVRPIYEKRVYVVTFKSADNVVETQNVVFGENAVAPEVSRAGYVFIDWDQELTNITRNLTVNALWQKITHASYSGDFNFSQSDGYADLLENLKTVENLSTTFTDVKYGGFRNTNFLVYYDETLSFNTNAYGLEVAINSDGIVIEKATKVSIPSGGFVLSGHGTSLDLLKDRVNLGDVIVYENNEAYIYRNTQASNVISILINLEKVKEKIIDANNEYLALDYIDIEKTYNEVVSLTNNLLESYNASDYNLASELILTIEFMLIEPKAST